jgi:hypothetical protein
MPFRQTSDVPLGALRQFDYVNIEVFGHSRTAIVQ